MAPPRNISLLLLVVLLAAVAVAGTAAASATAADDAQPAALSARRLLDLKIVGEVAIWDGRKEVREGCLICSRSTTSLARVSTSAAAAAAAVSCATV
jgi:hypothetical protein